MKEKQFLHIETTRERVFFYLDGILIYSAINELGKYPEYRYEGFDDYRHSDAYLLGNKIYVTLNLKNSDGNPRIIKTSYTLPKKKLKELEEIAE